MNGFDYTILIIISLSTIFAFFNGFIKTVLSLAGWILAAYAAVFLIPFLRPLLAGSISNDIILDTGAGFIGFIISIVVISIINFIILRMFGDIRGGFVDKSAGFVFGATRGVLFSIAIYTCIALAYPIIAAVKHSDTPDNFLQTPTEGVVSDVDFPTQPAKTGTKLETKIAESKATEKLPKFIIKSKTGKFLKTGSDSLMAMVPEDFMEKFSILHHNSESGSNLTTLAIIEKLTEALPYPDTYNKQMLQMKEEGEKTGKVNLVENRKVILQLIKDYKNAENHNLIKPENNVSKDEVDMLQNIVNNVKSNH